MTILQHCTKKDGSDNVTLIFTEIHNLLFMFLEKNNVHCNCNLESDDP